MKRLFSTKVPLHRLNNGTQMPMVGLGTWKTVDSECLVEAMQGAGYRHLDTAKVYDNEERVGNAIKIVQIPRDELYVTTKIPPADLPNAEFELKQSLKRLQLDYVDMYLIHWPTHYFKDHRMPLH